jgi:beta-lactam-binding protein with PASTA domain
LSHRLTIGATYYDEPELKDQEQFIYNQSPKEGEQIVEGEAISIYLSTDKEKSTRNTSGTQEEEDWF